MTELEQAKADARREQMESALKLIFRITENCNGTGVHPHVIIANMGEVEKIAWRALHGNDQQPPSQRGDGERVSD